MKRETQKMTPLIYKYPANVVRIIDGDTLKVSLDTGFHSQHVEKIRLYGVDCPEKSSRVAWEAAREYVFNWLNTGEPIVWPLLIETIEARETFGRYVARVTRRVDGADLAADLLTSGHALPYTARMVQ